METSLPARFAPSSNKKLGVAVRTQKPAVARASPRGTQRRKQGPCPLGQGLSRVAFTGCMNMDYRSQITGQMGGGLGVIAGRVG